MAVLCNVQYSALLIEKDLIFIIVDPILFLNIILSASLYFYLGKIGRIEKIDKENVAREAGLKREA